MGNYGVVRRASPPLQTMNKVEVDHTTLEVVDVVLLEAYKKDGESHFLRNQCIYEIVPNVRKNIGGSQIAKKGMVKRRRRKLKFVKWRAEGMNLILGQDVVMEQVQLYQATMFVGKLHGRLISKK